MYCYFFCWSVCSLCDSHLGCIVGCFIGLPADQIAWLQWVQNKAARLVLKKRKRDHVTPLLKELHWLPVKFRCQYKIATLVYRHFEGTLAPYLSSSLCTYEPSRSLRSSNEKLLKISNHLDNVLSVSWHHLSGILCRPL